MALLINSGVAPTPSLARSRAFREASLRSETRRAYAVVGVVLVSTVLISLPHSGMALPQEVRIIGGIGISVLFVLQLVILALIRRARRNDSDIPLWFIAATVVIECLIPTGMCAWHLWRNSLPPYAVLSAPPIFAYGVLICLTTLRLRPALCTLAGTISGAGYLGLYLYVTRVLGLAQSPTGLPGMAYINSALLIFITGLAAAWVTREVRAHVESALSEAELKHQMARVEQDLSIARTIQRALLPRTSPSIRGYDIAGWTRSADQTGGDYYDWQPLQGGNWIVTLADVSGHGVGPALVTAACRAYVRATSSSYPDLPTLTTRVNRLLADDLPEGRFVTMVSVLIDPKGGPIGLLSAGHGPIVLYLNSTGQVQDIQPQGLPLAVLPDSDFGPSQSISLGKGDILALVTDGFVEWSRPAESGRGEEFGLERLRDSLRRHAHLPSTDLIQAVANEAAAFAAGTPQQDDLTMVVIRRVS
jgi:serine phosphatase RsbU (regulator of sigma subunit)